MNFGCSLGSLRAATKCNDDYSESGHPTIVPFLVVEETQEAHFTDLLSLINTRFYSCSLRSYIRSPCICFYQTYWAYAENIFEPLRFYQIFY